ncbi:MAG: hypothetical protein NC395_10870 [Prevotella sp.]|nr:hypothetical protein [Prevotella sp.]
MSRFKFEINVEPKDIPSLDDVHKRDCADAIRGSIERVFKYTLVMSIGILAFFGLYSFFGVPYMIRMDKALPQISVILPASALAVFILEFIAGTMNRFALTAEAILHVLLIFISITTVTTIWIAPFALYGTVLHLKLLLMIPFYKVISEQAGYPEFTPLPSPADAAAKKADVGGTDLKKEKADG